MDFGTQALVKVDSWGLPLSNKKYNNSVVNLDSLLSDIYVRFIAMRQDDVLTHYRVFDTILKTLHANMLKVDSYFKRYSGAIQVAGSHFDRLRIKKPDEFDVEFPIGFPNNVANDLDTDAGIVLEPIYPTFFRLKMGSKFQSLPSETEWNVNKTFYSWKDDDYLLRSEFTVWFKNLVYKALNEFEEYKKHRFVYVHGIPYYINVLDHAPAVTLEIWSQCNGIKMSVDLVPGFKFSEDKWPTGDGYRSIQPEYSDREFMLVPEPVGCNQPYGCQSWRISLTHQEKKLFDGTSNLRQVIRYMKKLRDAQEMTLINSYQIKTLFFWEVIEHERAFWRQTPSTLFIIMVKKFHKYIEERYIPDFWNKKRNLIENLGNDVLVEYAEKLRKVVHVLDNPAEHFKLAQYLLTPSELGQYKVVDEELCDHEHWIQVQK